MIAGLLYCRSAQQTGRAGWLPSRTWRRSLPSVIQTFVMPTSWANKICYNSTPISKIQLQINIFIFFWGATVRLNFCTFLYGTIPVGKKYHSPALYISFILQIICKGQSYHQKVTISAAILIAIYSKKTFVLQNLIGVSRVPSTIENQASIFQCCNISLAWLLDQSR